MQGIALSADPNYKVLGAAYPWIARRLLTEQSIELQDTLRTLLYKKGRFQVASRATSAASSPLQITALVYQLFIELSKYIFKYFQTALPLKGLALLSRTMADV